MKVLPVVLSVTEILPQSMPEKMLEKEVERRSKQIIRDKLQTFETHYRRMRRGYSAFVFFTLSFATVMTMITAYRTEVFMQDLEEFFHMNGQVIEWIWVRIGNIASSVSSLGQIIPQDELARVIQGILWVIIVFLLIGIIDIPLLLCLGTIIKYVQKGQADEISVFVVLVELAFTFSFADEIKDLCKMNLLLIVFLVFVVYRVIRISMMKKMSNEDIIR